MAAHRLLFVDGSTSRRRPGRSPGLGLDIEV